MTNLKNIINLSNITGDVVAVGVSGGADSLALVLLLDEFLRPQGQRVVALTVDHGLRPESRTEAEYVAELMAMRGIEHHILVWEGVKPQHGIEEAARMARYDLLGGWCEANGVQTLCVAHHQQDQAETFFMRLQRGSGLTGLCGMAPVFYLKGLKIVRPLLSVSPQQLRNYLEQKHVRWVEDPSNQSEDFFRVRIRKFLPDFEKATGITPQRIAETMEILARSRDYLREQAEEVIDGQACCWDGAGFSLPRKFFEKQHSELIYQVLSTLLKKVGGGIYTPRAADVERLASVLKTAEFKGATLGGCEVFSAKGKIWIIPELRLKKKMPKTVWLSFIRQYPGYAKLDLPYKLRVALVKNKMAIEF